MIRQLLQELPDLGLLCAKALKVVSMSLRVLLSSGFCCCPFKVAVLFLIHCLLLLPLLEFLCVWSLFCYAVLCDLCTFATILLMKRGLVAILKVSS